MNNNFFFFCAALASAQFQCPPEDGFYRDTIQCDKYFDCYRGAQTEKMCPDGLVFDSSLGPRVEQCNYPFLAQCPDDAILRELKKFEFNFYCRKFFMKKCVQLLKHEGNLIKKAF